MAPRRSTTGKTPHLSTSQSYLPGGVQTEVRSCAKRIGVTAKEIHIRPMKRKWASCSTSGRFSFNEELLSQSSGFRKEVIVHELLHLKVPNHGKLFKALLRGYLTATYTAANEMA